MHGRFLDVLISMYSNDKSAVKIDNKLTEAFTCFAGVKQGCMMSPTLFNFYLSDLPKFLNTVSPTDIMLGDRSINCLLYADDLVKQCGPVVRALALRSGDPGSKTRSDHSLNLILVVPGSTSQLHL